MASDFKNPLGQARLEYEKWQPSSDKNNEFLKWLPSGSGSFRENNEQQWLYSTESSDEIRVVEQASAKRIAALKGACRSQRVVYCFLNKNNFFLRPQCITRHEKH